MIPPPTAYDLVESADKHWSEMHKLMAFGHETSIAASVACLWIRRAVLAESTVLAAINERNGAQAAVKIMMRQNREAWEQLETAIARMEKAEKALAELKEDYRRNRAKDI